MSRRRKPLIQQLAEMQRKVKAELALKAQWRNTDAYMDGGSERTPAYKLCRGCWLDMYIIFGNNIPMTQVCPRCHTPWVATV